VWHKAQKQVEIEKEQLNRLLETHQPLLVKCINTRPDPIELSALASMLHSFYTGIENILKRITVEFGESLPTSEFWHRDLLDSISRSTSRRPAVLSEHLKETLRNYLYFRHVFRHAYTFELRWEKMAELVLKCEDTLRRLEAELAAFFKDTEPGRSR
jgi:hypothetical protein